MTRHAGPLTRCLRCPTAFHYSRLQDGCMVAGTLQVTRRDVICYKVTSSNLSGRSCLPVQHCQPRKKGRKGLSPHINIDWCMACGFGGSLLCCEFCPAAMCQTCTGDRDRDTDSKFFCPSCVSGSLPRYNDLVWVKLGSYRWWPSKVVHPVNLPAKIERAKHQDGEFPVKFLGTKDYAWTNHGRVFLYAEGDSSTRRFLSSQHSTIDVKFRAGMEEAEELWGEMAAVREARTARAVEVGQGALPPPWQRLRTNKAVGEVAQLLGRRKGVEEEPSCDCSQLGVRHPCGRDSNCINRSGTGRSTVKKPGRSTVKKSSCRRT